MRKATTVYTKTREFGSFHVCDSFNAGIFFVVVCIWLLETRWPIVNTCNALQPCWSTDTIDECCRRRCHSHRRRWWRQRHLSYFSVFYEMNAHDLCTWKIWLVAIASCVSIQSIYIYAIRCVRGTAHRAHHTFYLHRKQHMAKVYVSANDSSFSRIYLHTTSVTWSKIARLISFAEDRLRSLRNDGHSLGFCVWVVNSSVEWRIGDNYDF